MPQLKTDMPHVSDGPTDFESFYLAVRALEGRIYTDLELKYLPEVPATHQHYKEWQVRKRSAKKLVGYLGKKKKSLNVLEIGCGNGWLAAQLAQIKNAYVFALDVNRIEIHQAKRIFMRNNLQFFDGDLKDQRFGGLKFDVIVFAASIQYFSPLADMVTKMMPYLTDDGEIHITDSNFYNPFTVNAAVERTQEYYSAIRYPEMAAFYFHHRLDELEGFNYKILKKPAGILNRLLKGGPFYWIKIKKNA